MEQPACPGGRPLYDFRAMAIFVEVIKHQSMQQAARQLGLTVSTVSLAISRLEQQHGIRLLHRTTRRLSATSAGEAFYQACLRMLEGAEQAHRVLEQQKHEIEGTLRIATFSSVCGLPLGDSLKALLERYPALNIEWYVDDSFSNLYRQQIDIAIRGGMHALNDPQLIARKLFDAEMVLCATPEYLANRPPIERPQDLYTHQWLDYQQPDYRLTHPEHGEIHLAPRLSALEGAAAQPLRHRRACTGRVPGGVCTGQAGTAAARLASGIPSDLSRHAEPRTACTGAGCEGGAQCGADGIQAVNRAGFGLAGLTGRRAAGCAPLKIF